MMRTSNICSLLFIALLGHAAIASAQTTPSQAPPKLEKIEEVDNPVTVTANPDNEKKITEKREGGRVTEAKVKSGKSSYTLKPNTPVGTALPGDLAGRESRGAQWTVMEFDVAKKKKQRSEDRANAADEAPAPPPPPPATR
ncbi:hypothetical protein HUX62_23525 [Massilia sp. BJB1822]|nr:hypothetical protein [Massilia sp. BJB1822]